MKISCYIKNYFYILYFFIRSFIKKILLQVLRRTPLSPLIIGPAKGSIRHSELIDFSLCEHGVQFENLQCDEDDQINDDWQDRNPSPENSTYSAGHTNGMRGIFILNKGATIAESGWILTRTGYLMHDLTHHFWGVNHPSPILNGIRICHRRLKQHKLCSFQLPASNNYFHWMMDVVPRIALFNKSRYHCDFFYVASHLPFQNETLDRIGIPAYKRIQPEKGVAVTAKELIVPSLLHISGKPSKFTCDTLRALFSSELEKVESMRRLYIRRGDAKNTRAIQNEPDLIEFLTLQNFEIVVMDHLSVSEQAALFSSADIIVAAHGAALTNLVFCPSGTSIVEIFGKSYINSCYWEICSHTGLHYRAVIEFGDATVESKQCNFRVNILQVQKALQDLGKITQID